jgi:ABC-type branched-subunit amino acid transport system ATPase component
MLSVRDLHVTYGGTVRALRGVDLDVEAGQVVAVLGSNGAGKTTLLRTISSTLRLHRGRVDGGSITFDGADLDTKDPARCVAAGLVQVPEGRRIFTRLTVEENLRAGGLGQKDKALKAKAHERVLDLFPVLAQRRLARAGLLSGGEQQMLAIGRALMGKPRLLLLDEPSMGLAPMVVAQIFNIVREINESGVTVLLVEQNAAQALALADRGYVLETGDLVLQGTGSELLADDRIRAAYLGEEIAAS